MVIVEQVRKGWKELNKKTQRWVKSESMTAKDAGWRMRCKIVYYLARGEMPMRIAQYLDCARSHVYRMAHRFIQHGPEGLVDRREDNGDRKADEKYAACLLVVVEGAPTQHGYDRPTWTQELLVLVCAQEDRCDDQRHDHESLAVGAACAAWASQTNGGLSLGKSP